MTKSDASRPPTGSSPSSTVKNTHTLLGFLWSWLMSFTCSELQAHSKRAHRVTTKVPRWFTAPIRADRPVDCQRQHLEPMWVTISLIRRGDQVDPERLDGVL